MADILPHGPGVTVETTAMTAQWLLQCPAADGPSIGAAAGMTLGAPLLIATQTGDWYALHLSPDEWLLIADDGADQAVPERLRAVDRAFSLVDVSDRSLGLVIEGPAALDLLASACPLDLERLVDGACTRTLLGKATVVLWRRGARWQISYGRSFHEYLTRLFSELVADLSPA